MKLYRVLLTLLFLLGTTIEFRIITGKKKAMLKQNKIRTLKLKAFS